MTESEFSQMYLKGLALPNKKLLKSNLIELEDGEIPDTIDWHKDGKVSTA